MYSSTLANAQAPNPIFDISFRHSWACPKIKSRGGFLGKWWESENKKYKRKKNYSVVAL